jgi:hypothetical protein
MYTLHVGDFWVEWLNVDQYPMEHMARYYSEDSLLPTWGSIPITCGGAAAVAVGEVLQNWLGILTLW